MCPVFFFPDWLLKHNENILSNQVFRLSFFFLRQRVHGTLRNETRREWNVKEKKSFLNEEKKKKSGGDGWAQAVDFGWWSSRLNFGFFAADPKRCFFFFDLDVELRWRRLFMRQRPEGINKGIGQKGSHHILRVISSRTGDRDETDGQETHPPCARQCVSVSIKAPPFHL